MSDKKLKPISKPVKGKEEPKPEIIKTDGGADPAIRPTKPPKL